MKQLCLFAGLFLLFGVLSCDKKDEITPPGELPSWVKQKAEALADKKGDSCKFIDVLIYQSLGKRYYNIDFGYSSCNRCNMYDEKGRAVSQSDLAKLTDLKVVEIKQACL